MSWLMKQKRQIRVAPARSLNGSMQSSNESLTPSQLDLAVVDMLQANLPKNHLKSLCRGNPITSSGKRKQLYKMVAIVMIPVAMLTGLTLNTFFATFTNYIQSSKIRETLLYSVELGAVIHYLQEERDMSALYLSSITEKTKTLLLERYPETDRSLEKLTFWTTGPTLTRPEFQSKDKFLSYLNGHRLTLEQEKNITFRLSKWLRIKYNPNMFQGNQMLMGVLGRMRAEIRRNDLAGRGSVRKAQLWFGNMTVYMDILLGTQKELANEITQMLDERQTSNLKKMVAISVVFVCVLTVCPAIICAVYSLTEKIQKISMTVAERTKALNKEKRRTDTLLYQMLPKSVADILKRNEEVKAENYSEATIFFSDIQGFTKISARSSPVQVVHMLNSLYSCFDDRIALYDVYKVETIGDGYMVVSGLPKRNEKLHAVEISTMALDLLHHISRLKIPHLPGTKFKLRIGCHTGSVVAGVVGTKMPRYCLFGETVIVASKMETLGKCGKIHISQNTRDALRSFMEFSVEEREDPAAKDDEELQMFLKGTVHTYWLHGKEGMTVFNHGAKSSYVDYSSSESIDTEDVTQLDDTFHTHVLGHH